MSESFYEGQRFIYPDGRWIEVVALIRMPRRKHPMPYCRNQDGQEWLSGLTLLRRHIKRHGAVLDRSGVKPLRLPRPPIDCLECGQPIEEPHHLQLRHTKEGEDGRTCTYEYAKRLARVRSAAFVVERRKRRLAMREEP